jgi:hypothetical protein
MRKEYPSFYEKNVVKNAERKYMADGKTKQEREEELQQEAAEIIKSYVLFTLRTKRAEETVKKVEAEQEALYKYYMGMCKFSGERTARARIREMAECAADVNIRYWYQLTRGRNKRIQIVQKRAEEEIACWCIALKSIVGWSREEIGTTMIMAWDHYVHYTKPEESKR